MFKCPVDFKAYMIVSLAEMRSHQNALTRKLKAPKQNGRQSIQAADDPLYGLHADHIDVWNNFDQRLRRDKKFFDAVV